MPELTFTHIVLLAVLAIIGVVAGWFARDRRAAQEQDAVREMWQEQVEMQRRERKRLAAQNKKLMEQVSRQQAKQSRLKKSAAEFSTAMRDAGTRRDELQREIESRDARIEALAQDLRNWQDRLPPLMDRYRKRKEEAEQLKSELAAARSALRRLEEQHAEAPEHPVAIKPLSTAGQFTDGLEASNDEEDLYVDEVDNEETPVFLDESTMIESGAVLDDLQAHAQEVNDESQAHAAETDVESQAHASETEVGSQAHAAETEVESQAHASETEDAGSAAPDDADDPLRQRDNLKKINGVGPAIEKTLNEMGIISYRQIADMTDYDIDRVARRLKGFQGRIQSEDWIGQARTLLDEAALA